jgi:hypothetical protein
MAKAKIRLSRHPPKRAITKQQAVRHLLHSAGRMIAAREDPFAIHLLIQSADKLLIDLAKKTGRELAFRWDEFIKPEYKNGFIESIRETSNFFKHADKDHDSELYVGEIAKTNILQLGLCIVNYRALFGEWTDHMRLLFNFAKLISPDGFVQLDQRIQFDAVFHKFNDSTLAELLSGWWTDPILRTDPTLRTTVPNLESEKTEDLQDTQPFYDTRISDLIREKWSLRTTRVHGATFTEESTRSCIQQNVRGPTYLIEGVEDIPMPRKLI